MRKKIHELSLDTVNPPTLFDVTLVRRTCQVTCTYLEVESIILWWWNVTVNGWYFFLRIINVRGDGHPQVCVQSTKVRFRTGLGQENWMLNADMLLSICDVKLLKYSRCDIQDANFDVVDDRRLLFVVNWISYFDS